MISEPRPLGQSVFASEYEPLVDPMFPRFEGSGRDVGRRKERVGSTTPAEMMTNQPTPQARADGTRIINSDENPAINVMIDKGAEGYRQMHGVGPIQPLLHSNTPNAGVNMPPRVEWPPLFPKKTSYDADDQSVRSQATRRESTTGKRFRTHRRLKQDLMDRLDASSIIGASGVMSGLPGDGNDRIRKVDMEPIPSHRSSGLTIFVGILELGCPNAILDTIMMEPDGKTTASGMRMSAMFLNLLFTGNIW